jgi:hypothetical protein
MNYYSLSILSVSHDSIFKDYISFYSDSVFADDLWISIGIVCLTIPCLKHESIFSIGFMRLSWFLRRCRLHKSAVTHTSVAISRSPVTFFSLTISGRLGRSFHWQFHAWTMTLFSLLISFLIRELVCALDSIRPPWLNFQRLFLVLQWLSFRRRFMDQHWHSVFDDSIPQTWIYFCYRFYASLVNSLTLSTPYVSCQSYFCGDFKVYGHSVFADDFWSVVTQFSLTIPCVNDDSVFSIDFIRQPRIRICCGFHPSPLT